MITANKGQNFSDFNHLFSSCAHPQNRLSSLAMRLNQKHVLRLCFFFFSFFFSSPPPPPVAAFLINKQYNFYGSQPMAAGLAANWPR
jgi:hypothetical protein